MAAWLLLSREPESSPWRRQPCSSIEVLSQNKTSYFTTELIKKGIIEDFSKSFFYFLIYILKLQIHLEL